MEFTVRPTTRGEAGNGTAAVSAEAMESLAVAEGDWLRLETADGAVAVASVRPESSGNWGETDVRIGKPLRRSLGVGLGDAVTVEATDVASADRVTLALPDIDPADAAELDLRAELVGRGAVAGQTLALARGSSTDSGTASYPADSVHRLPVRVEDTDPSGPVVVEEWTHIAVSSGPAEAVPELTGRGGSGTVTYRDVGGLDAELAQLRELVELPMRHPGLFRSLGVESPTGVLLRGPSGTGKTLVARAMAAEIDADVHRLSGPKLAAGPPGTAAERLREAFEAATEAGPSVVFVDDLDAIAGDRDDGRDGDAGAVAQLLASMDDLDEGEGCIVLGATDRVDALDPALRRAGRFDREIELGVPDRAGREEILRVHARDVPLTEDVDLETLAGRTHGFVGADLENLLRESAMAALRRADRAYDLDADDLDPAVFGDLSVTADDVGDALRHTEPSALREVFVEVPDVSWSDVGGLDETKQRLQETVQWPLEHAEAFARVDLQPAKGILLYGPPGTGKTLLARAVASEADSNFISLKGPELFDKYVGESERGVREVFAKARENAPTVVFFDEIDALAGERGRGAGDSGVGERVVSQLLTELDGLEDLEDVVVVATTNRPELLDDALLRPGRFDRHVHVTAPDEAARREIFAVHTRTKPLADDVDLDAIARETDGYVGADIEAVCREAATAAVREHVQSGASDASGIVLTAAHFERALREMNASGTGGERFVRESS